MITVMTVMMMIVVMMVMASLFSLHFSRSRWTSHIHQSLGISGKILRIPFPIELLLRHAPWCPYWPPDAGAAKAKVYCNEWAIYGQCMGNIWAIYEQSTTRCWGRSSLRKPGTAKILCSNESMNLSPGVEAFGEWDRQRWQKSFPESRHQPGGARPEREPVEVDRGGDVPTALRAPGL